MADRHLIGPIAPATPAKSTGSRRHQHALPNDLLRDASRRLGIMSFVAAGLWTLGAVGGHLAVRSMSHGDPQWLRLGVPDLIVTLSVLASVGLSFYARLSDRDPRRILDFGLVYMVLTSFALSLMFHWEPMAADQRIEPQISWSGAVVLMFAAILPSTPAKTAIAALIAVSMNPISMLIARSRGSWPFPSPWDALLMHYPDFFLVGVAAVISHVLTFLSQQVVKAREMGSYELGDLIGRGGMGEVYKATHRMLARPAAIKLIRPEMIGASDPEGAKLAVLRFRREAEAAANLRSPHTVELYDFGLTDEGTLYFVMELLEGLDLESLVRQYGPVPAPRVVHILRQACGSLEEAHARGLMHRDIKPANIHLGRLGLVFDFVKVLDFGLVKPITDRAADSSLTTEAGLLVGTPGYLAPEMAIGEEADGRADLYALGCVAYYLLTGEQVFTGATAMQVISRHLETAPAPPSTRGQFGIPPGLDEIILSCLAKKPADRPQGAAELKRRLTALAIEPWTEAHAAEWWAMKRPQAATAAAVPVMARVVSSSDALTRLDARSGPPDGDAVTIGGSAPETRERS